MDTIDTILDSLHFAADGGDIDECIRLLKELDRLDGKRWTEEQIERRHFYAVVVLG